MRHRCRLATAALAGLLLAPTSVLAQAGAGAIRGELPAVQAGEFIGRTATVCGVVDGTRFAETTEGQPTFLFMAGNFPAHRFSARIWGRDRGDFATPPEQLAGKTVCVTGEIRNANGRPEIVVRGARNLRVR